MRETRASTLNPPPPPSRMVSLIQRLPLWIIKGQMISMLPMSQLTLLSQPIFWQWLHKIGYIKKNEGSVYLPCSPPPYWLGVWFRKYGLYIKWTTEEQQHAVGTENKTKLSISSILLLYMPRNDISNCNTNS